MNKSTVGGSGYSRKELKSSLKGLIVRDASTLPATDDFGLGRIVESCILNTEASVGSGRLVSTALGCRFILLVNRRPVAIVLREPLEDGGFVLEGSSNAIEFQNLIKLAERLRSTTDQELTYFTCRPFPVEMVRVGKLYLWRRRTSGTSGCVCIGSLTEFLSAMDLLASKYANEFVSLQTRKSEEEYS
jgi:hypothetical protein